MRVGRPPREIEELAFRVLPRLSYEFADSPHHHYILSPANIETTLCMAVDPIAGSINVRGHAYITMIVSHMHLSISP
jgi:hypothetical protein